MTDIVERLRDGWPSGDGTTDGALKAHRSLEAEAADEIERLIEACDGYLGELAAMRENKDAEIERLQHMQANLHGHVKRLEDENAKLKAYVQDVVSEADHFSAENAKLREALRHCITYLEQCTNSVETVEEARAALQKDEGK